jgi:dipeptidyl aminopeptidase/acylaminoacyl peptidase
VALAAPPLRVGNNDFDSNTEDIRGKKIMQRNNQKALLRWIAMCVILILLSCDKGNPIIGQESHPGKLVFIMNDSTVGPWGIYTMNLDGRNLTPVVIPGDSIFFPGPWGEYFILDNYYPLSFPRWSPDGTKIVCELMWAFEGYVIMLMNADGTNKHVLWEVRSAAQSPQWSPEGDRILFLRSGYAGAIFAIGIVDSSGKNDRDFRVFDGRPIQFEGDSLWPNWDFQWGPTGSMVYASHTVNQRPGNVVGENPHNEVFSFDSRAGVVLQRLTRNTIDEGGFRISPDGQTIAYRRGLYQQPSTLYFLKVDDNSLQEKKFESYVDVCWNWSKAGKLLVFAQDIDPDLYRNEEFRLYLLDASNGVVDKISNFRAMQPDLFVAK